jgi:hypothetical protein
MSYAADPLLRHVQRRPRAILIVDMVESVRLIGQDEEGVVCRWLNLVDRVVTQVLPGSGGRLVKSLGDGMLLEFGDIRSAASAAISIQQESAQASPGLPADEQMFLRMGIEFGDVIVDHRCVWAGRQPGSSIGDPRRPKRDRHLGPGSGPVDPNAGCGDRRPWRMSCQTHPTTRSSLPDRPSRPQAGSQMHSVTG